MRPFLTLILLASAIPLHAAAGNRSVDSVACPSSDFRKFISVFSLDPQVQKTYTMSPLRYDHIDINTGPEPKVVSELIKQPKPSYYELLTKPKMAERKLKPTVKVQSPQRAVLELY